MNDAPSNEPTAEPNAASALESGTYEVIRKRLREHGQDLDSRVQSLNASRKDVFGSVETTLLDTQRITTPHNCIPRDIIAVGQRVIFGYNVQFGLKTQTQVSDVFTVFERDDEGFHERGKELIEDSRFESDFKDLYKYYKKTTFAKFAVIGPHLFMVFRVGRDIFDIKVFKWALQDGSLTYIDNRGEHDFRYPPQHDFEWTRTHRDLHRTGRHPHIAIEDRLFVETLGGDLTIKIEDNTDTGEGIYSEPVSHKDQTLDDADVFYAGLDNLILLKITPYQEDESRYFVYNEKVHHVKRIDSIEDSCVLLPQDQGIIFANGYYLQTGDIKIFESEYDRMWFEKRLQAPNGEDSLYVFYNRESGHYILLSYNIIEQAVGTPVICNGYTFLPTGELVFFKCQDEAQKHHAIQIWQTPYMASSAERTVSTDSHLQKIGNQDIVRAMSECHEIVSLCRKEDTYADLYVDISKRATDVLDAYSWLRHDEAFDLHHSLVKIRDASAAAVEEFEKVARVKKSTAERFAEAYGQTQELLQKIRSQRFESLDDFVRSLGQLRALRGTIISLRDLRYVDLERVESLETEVQEAADGLASRCVTFILEPTALDVYRERLQAHQGRAESLETAKHADDEEQEIAQTSSELETLIETVSNLKIDDATKRTAIIDDISQLFSELNQVRARVKNRKKDLRTHEGKAEFNSQLKLLGQSSANYLDVCDTPEKCEEYLTKLMVQLEELEGRFAEFEEFIEKIGEKRQEIYDAFESRKLAIREARGRKAESFRRTAERILAGVKTRVESLSSIDEINGYFAADLMVDKVRDVIERLIDIGDTVKADEIQSRLKAIKEETVRELKDRSELYEDGDNLIRLGRHLFSVNRQNLELTTVHRERDMLFHLTGTAYFSPIEDEAFRATRESWNQEVVSENADVYRGEYLAYLCFQDARERGRKALEELRGRSDDERRQHVQSFMATRFDEAYTKGVHDHDATKILGALLKLEGALGLLVFRSPARALARYFWLTFEDDERRDLIRARCQGLQSIRDQFPDNRFQNVYVEQIQASLETHLNGDESFAKADIPSAASYLLEQLMEGEAFVSSPRAHRLLDTFHSHLRGTNTQSSFEHSVEAVRDHHRSRFLLIRDWVLAFARNLGDSDFLEVVDEASMALFDQEGPLLDVEDSMELEGLIGDHASIEGGRYSLRYDHFNQRLHDFHVRDVPRFRDYQRLKKTLLEEETSRLRLGAFEPRVLTSFVRNKLIDQVYLRLIGDNFAKQIGAAGEGKRTDLMGLLLLISPPGYGKTTLMEYVANRLGITFVKVNGPALGHRVTSLDPSLCPDASARDEIEKLNLALEMGDNVMIYLDDIQHCHPELLQKFISLCDGQRRIEGVFRGQAKTYDLRGRKVAVVMAGNPYTESGEKFKIPDMLANRADTYNLGDILGENDEAFNLSYVENCLTSNPVLGKLATRSQKDVYAMIDLAEDRPREEVSFEGTYSAEEVEEIVSSLRKLLRIRDVVLRVNQEYIRSAAQADEYRTEPPFKLQGSYRNMNKMAEKVLAVMNDDEIETLIATHYEGEAQTLTTGAEANILKFKELLGLLNDQEQARWDAIKDTFVRNLKMRGAGSDRMGQAIAQLTEFREGLDAIRTTLEGGVESLSQARSDSMAPDLLEKLTEALTRSPVEAAASPEVRVINKVPSSIHNVIRAQFKVMEGWMQPLIAALSDRDERFTRLQEDLKKTHDDYEALLNQLDEARSKDEDPDVDEG